MALGTNAGNEYKELARYQFQRIKRQQWQLRGHAPVPLHRYRSQKPPILQQIAAAQPPSPNPPATRTL